MSTYTVYLYKNMQHCTAQVSSPVTPEQLCSVVLKTCESRCLRDPPATFIVLCHPATVGSRLGHGSTHNCMHINSNKFSNLCLTALPIKSRKFDVNQKQLQLRLKTQANFQALGTQHAGITKRIPSHDEHTKPQLYTSNPKSHHRSRE